MRATIAAALLVAAYASPAWGFGGSGYVLGTATVPDLGPARPDFGTMECQGGVGFGVNDHRRIGGEGHYCEGDLARAGFGGVQVGWHSRGSFLWTSMYSGLGAGGIQATTPDARAWQGAFVYVRPTVSVGVALGFAALELGGFVNLPVNVWQQSAGYQAVPLTPMPGAEVSLLFGNFRKQQAPCGQEPVPAATLPPPPPVTPAPIAPPPRPLALPPAAPIPPPPA